MLADGDVGQIPAAVHGEHADAEDEGQGDDGARPVVDGGVQHEQVGAAADE